MRRRLELHWFDSASHSSVEAPTVHVTDAFTSGGAQVAGGRHDLDFEFASDLDYVRGKHTFRTGVLLEGGWYQDRRSSNYLGTYTLHESRGVSTPAGPRSYTMPHRQSAD